VTAPAGTPPVAAIAALVDGHDVSRDRQPGLPDHPAALDYPPTHGSEA
jgi:hypothetical protein